MKFLISLLALLFLFSFPACKSTIPPTIQETFQEAGESTEQEGSNETGKDITGDDISGADVAESEIIVDVDEYSDADIDANADVTEEFSESTLIGEELAELTELMEFDENPLDEEEGETPPGNQDLEPPVQLEAEPQESPLANAPAEVPRENPFVFPRVFPPESPDQTPAPAQTPLADQTPAPAQTPLANQTPPPEQRPPQEQAPPSREPTPQPPFVRPSEPEVPPPQRQQVPGQDDPSRLLPELPASSSSLASEEEFVFSRVARLMVGQMLEIPFRGAGWVYLGELCNRRGLAYDSRRLDLEAGLAIGQSFIFRADASGTYILKFYKQDFIQDNIINDYVQVIVGERTEDSGTGRPGNYIDRGRVVAEPRWPPVPGSESGQEPSTAGTAVTGQAGASGTEPILTDDAPMPTQVDEQPQAASGIPDAGITDITPSGPVEGAAQAGPVTGFPADALPDEFVRQARQEFDAGHVEQAIGTLDLMRQRFPNGTDEAWWLYAQLLEANSLSRDIKLALEYYRRLVEEYPQSNRAGDARGRIAYLERFYINIR